MGACAEPHPAAVALTKGRAGQSQEEVEVHDLEERDQRSSLLLVIGKLQSCPFSCSAPPL
jgi:hypothetical protein